jgi:hypothetical protein
MGRVTQANVGPTAILVDELAAGPFNDAPGLLKRVHSIRNGLMHRSKQHRQSTISSAVASSVGTVPPD